MEVWKMFVNKEILLHIYENFQNPRTLTKPNAGENVEQKELSFITGGNAKFHGHCEQQFFTSLQN